MNTDNVSGNQKRDRKRKLLPLLALIVGLGVPVLAHAASESECNWCHYTWANSVCSSAQQSCYATCNWDDYYCWQGLQACYNQAGATCQAAHAYCEQPGNGCVD